MEVFISSIVGGCERYRAAAQEAVQMLGHQVIRAEDFAATARTPQQACLDGVRASDIVLLLIGERYGVLQPSRLSATHEEYQEARERKPVLVFVESGVTGEPAQQAFLDEVQAWAIGHHRAGFSSPEELSRAVVRAIHEHELATSSGPVDEAEIVLPATGARRGTLAVASGGPGASGVMGAEAFVSLLGPRILERFDIVFFDPRGVGRSGGIDCPEAFAVWNQVDGRARTPGQEATVNAGARTFARDCVREAGPEARRLLPYVETDQAVEDLEAFRRLLGDDRFWLYGESYGIQYAQTYAAAHGDTWPGWCSRSPST